MATKRAFTPYDPDLERKTYDKDYYENHVKYYEKGIPFFEMYLRDYFDFDSIADCGCGTGAFVAGLQDEKKVFGFDYSDGSKKVSFLKPENFYDVDLTEENSTQVAKGVDIAMSLEVYEHIKPAFEDNYLGNVFGLGAKHVIISCAPPGQWGRHHYNCKSTDEVRETVAEKYPEYEVDEERTEAFKRIKKLASFYRKNTLVFRKKDV